MTPEEEEHEFWEGWWMAAILPALTVLAGVLLIAAGARGLMGR